jgi:hypothetical protein
VNVEGSIPFTRLLKFGMACGPSFFCWQFIAKIRFNGQHKSVVACGKDAVVDYSVMSFQLVTRSEVEHFKRKARFDIILLPTNGSIASEIFLFQTDLSFRTDSLGRP